MSIPLAAVASPASVLLASLLLVAVGLLAMLLPQALVRRALRGRDPATAGMCAFALGLAASGLLLVVLASGAATEGNGSPWLAAACGGVLLVAAVDLLRSAPGVRRMRAVATPPRWRTRVLLAVIARR